MNTLLHKYLLYFPVLFLKKQSISKHFDDLQRSQWYNYRRLKQIQLQKLVKLLTFAKSNIPFYKKALEDIDVHSISSLDVLNKIPILTKEMLKANSSELRNNGEKHVIKKTTGGSTGNPVTVYQSASAVGAADAAYWRGYGWAGVKICDKQGRFWGIPKSRKAVALNKVKDFILNRHRNSAFSFSKSDMQIYFDKMNSFKPVFLYGYVSMIEAFANYILRNNLTLSFQPTCVIATSEVLTQTHRKLFEKAFNCSVFNEYGCGEIGTIAHECECGNMHINVENCIVEILNDGAVVDNGCTGDIVVTDLNNTGMPLIRYNLKDIGFLDEKLCECDRGLPVLGNVVGRAYDIIFNKEGKSFHGEYFMYIFEELQDAGIYVNAFQVIQEDYINFKINIVMEENNREQLEKYINKRVRSSYGDYAKIQYNYIANIKRENSGKIRLIKTKISNRHTI